MEENILNQEETHEAFKAGGEMYDKAQHAASEAYDKTSKAANETFVRARAYTRENPEKAALIAMGIGVGLGLILCSRQSRTARTTNAVLDAAYDVARAFLR